MPLAHDLLWGMTPAQLPADAPQWAVDSLRAGQPVVVRRAMSADGFVAVGVRGVLREQRLAAFMAVDSIACRVSPEALCHVDMIATCRPCARSNSCGRCSMIAVGSGASVAVPGLMASGFAAMHEGSDLDLILRTPHLLARNQARELVALFDQAACRVDMQLQTPFGAVALREWAGPSARVLLKNAIRRVWWQIHGMRRSRQREQFLVFPGQGAQQPGMLQRLPRETLVEASDVLGEDVLLLDSAEALRTTRAVQLCLLIAGTAASRQLLQHGLTADYVAGLSIGAYPAAVVAGALSFSDALHLVSLRGELMQQAYPQGFGMTAIIGLRSGHSRRVAGAGSQRRNAGLSGQHQRR